MHFIWFSREPDLIIELEDQHRHQIYGFLVVKACLRASSHLFYRILDPRNGFKPLPQTSLNDHPITVLRLHDDDIAALGWLLNIIHFQTDIVPRILSRDDLLAVATLCDKYGWQRPVGLWAEKWVAALLLNEGGPAISLNESESSPDGSHKETVLKAGCEDWLFIAQAFPNLDSYTPLLRRIFDTLVEEIVGDMDVSEEVSRLPKGSKEKKMIDVVFDLVPQSVVSELELNERGKTEIKCQEETGCPGATLASSMASSVSQVGWDIEATYCVSCIRKKVSPWVLSERLSKLREMGSYYSSARNMRYGNQHPGQRANEHHNLNIIGNTWNIMEVTNSAGLTAPPATVHDLRIPRFH
ncbi:hypothetical protein TWF730_002995 [Orbilia blumenaviensis]|uniref:BTB domain-containing protein n=1 Tax=Orbilia blumenaviensis TaxID=1796055 RepID=A0AAV9UC55_9PEZI